MARRVGEVLGRVLVGTLLVGAFAAPVSGSGPRLTEREQWVLGNICARCHVSPGLGAPLLGDHADWTVRRERGFEAVLRNTVLGVGDMPPLGTCGFCTEDDLRAIVLYMLVGP